MDPLIIALVVVLSLVGCILSVYVCGIGVACCGACCCPEQTLAAVNEAKGRKNPYRV